MPSCRWLSPAPRALHHGIRPGQFKKHVEILKVLYDEDILEGDHLKWGADPKSAARFGVELETSQLVRKQVKPFLEWLATADDDSDSD